MTWPGIKPYLYGGLAGAAILFGAARVAPALPRFCHCTHPDPGPNPAPIPIPPNPGPGPLPKPDWLPDGPPAPPPFVPDPMAAKPAPAWEWRPWPPNPKWEMHGRTVDGEFLVNEWRPVDAK